jgi:hypothetical protein
MAPIAKVVQQKTTFCIPVVVSLKRTLPIAMVVQLKTTPCVALVAWQTTTLGNPMVTYVCVCVCECVCVCLTSSRGGATF